jgi:hypothetical protein
VVATSIGQQGVDQKDAGSAGAMNSISQQIGSAIGVAVISTFVATATTHYLTSHTAIPGSVAEATVHGFSVGYWWAAGTYVVAALICGFLIRPKTYAHHHTGAELGDEAIGQFTQVSGTGDAVVSARIQHGPFKGNDGFRPVRVGG